MLDFRSDRRTPPPPGFTLDRRQLAQARGRGLKTREWRLLITMPIAVAVLVLAGQYLMGLRIATGEVEQFPIEHRLEAMPRPDLATAPDLPDATAVAAVMPAVASLVEERAGVRHDDALDAATLAWAAILREHDRLAPPPPQRLDASELVLGPLPAGAPLLVTGRLEDARGDTGNGHTWQRLLLALEDGQYALALADDTTRQLPIGAPVQIAGRSLGWCELPGPDGAVRLPLLLATAAVRAPGGMADDNAYRGTVHLPADLWEGISDERLAIEQRPYFYLLGQVAADRGLDADAYAGAPSANALGNDIHQQPQRFRGQAFRVTGYVYRAWEDPAVAERQPWGITRVVRVLLWSRDFGAVTELVNGQPRVRTQILRLYELAMITDQPLPQRMDRIAAAGRFIKFHAIAVQSDPTRDRLLGIARQSDRAYTYFFATGPYSVLPPPPIYEFGPWSLITVLVTTSLATLLWILWRRDAAAVAALGPQLRAMRAARRARQPSASPPQSTSSAHDSTPTHPRQ